MPLKSKSRSVPLDFHPDVDHEQVDPERISLFKVPLACEAAAGLGCGVKAKPILKALVRQPGVAQVWLNRNGTLAAEPRVVRQEGVDSSNGRYARRVIDLGIAAFKGCSPLELPQEYYQTSNGGWSNLNYHWQLR